MENLWNFSVLKVKKLIQLFIAFIEKIWYSIRIMKTVLSEILGFVLLCVCGTVAGGFLFMLYGASTSYVVGSNINVFLPNTFLDGMLICFTPVMLFVPMLRMLSLIRHESKNKVLGLITISVLSFATWVFCVPICAKTALYNDTLSTKAPSELTAGYFRKMDNSMYYFNAIRGNKVDALKFENSYSNKNKQNRSVELLKDYYIDFKRDKYGFSDPIVGEYLEPPSTISAFFLGLYSIEKSAFQACNNGVISWLLFSSLMLALIAVGALITISSWRLVCMFWALLSTSAILVLNYLYTNFYFAPFLNQLEYRGAFFDFIKNNFQTIMNCTFVFVFVIAGVLRMLYKNKNLVGDDL